jgi:hypothetical protein
MDHYYKLISKQDKTKSFVINKRAAIYFFKLPHLNHGDEFTINIIFKGVTEIVKTVVHQDVRILLKFKEYKIGDIAYFKKQENGLFLLHIISKNDEIQKIKSYLNSKNYYLSNQSINYGN